MEAKSRTCCDKFGQVQCTNSVGVGGEILISVMIPYLFPHLLQELRTLARQRVLHVGSACYAAMFMHCITVTHMISFLFSRSSCFTHVHSFCLFFYVEQKAKCHKILGLKKWKLRVLLLFKGSMGTMVLFDFAVCSNSGSHPFWLPCVLIPGPTAHLHQGPRQWRPGSSYITTWESFHGFDLEPHWDWAHIIQLMLEQAHELMSLAGNGVDQLKWLSDDELFPGFID